MRIIFVRHGESEANVADRINDDPRRPVSLTDRGKNQAAAAAERLRRPTFTHAYASEFPRAQQTARIILHHHACDLRIDARLNERRSGMDGLPVSAFNDPASLDPLDFKPSAGESFREQIERLRGFLAALQGLGERARVLAVSHENPILAVQALAGVEPSVAVRGAVPNCGLIVVERQAGAWRLAATAADQAPG